MTSSGEQAAPDIYIVGTGVRVPDHMTIEAIEALTRCREIYTILHPSMEALLPREIAPKIKSLWPLYTPGSYRRDVYDAEIATVLDAASQQKTVAYLAPGNPVIFDSVTHGIIAGAPARGLTVQVIPGISSIDSILVDLHLDLAPGIQIFDASFLLANNVELRPDVACILFQPTAFGTSYVTVGYQPLSTAFAPLREYLMRFYPPDHEIMYVTSAERTHEISRVVRFPLQELGGTQDTPQTPGASLFIPPAQRPEMNTAFLEQMSNPESLRKGYRAQTVSAEQG